jgi:hypothetical protein
MYRHPPMLSDTEFFSFKDNHKLLPKYCLFQQNSRKQSCTYSKDAINGLLTKIQNPYLIIDEFSNMMIENTSHDTITDSSLWAFLHENGSFLLKTSDIHEEILFFLLWF